MSHSYGCNGIFCQNKIKHKAKINVPGSKFSGQKAFPMHAYKWWNINLGHASSTRSSAMRQFFATLLHTYVCVKIWKGLIQSQKRLSWLPFCASQHWRACFGFKLLHLAITLSLQHRFHGFKVLKWLKNRCFFYFLAACKVRTLKVVYVTALSSKPSEELLELLYSIYLSIVDLIEMCTLSGKSRLFTYYISQYILVNYILYVYYDSYISQKYFFSVALSFQYCFIIPCCSHRGRHSFK